MITEEDIKNLKEVLATKEDINNLSVKLVTLEEFDQFKKEIKQDINDLREAIQALTVSVDKLVKFMADSMQEDVMAKNKFERYDRWFKIISEKLGLKLEP
jgi:dynactin complex subunit